MTEFLSYLVVIVSVGALVFWFLIGDEEGPVVQLPSSDELKKLKKAELVELADSYDIFVDIKSTKAVIIKEIELHR
jgi:hypothetical protein